MDGTLDPGLKTQDLEGGTRDSRSGTQLMGGTPDSRPGNLKSILYIRPETQHTESGTWNPYDKKDQVCKINISCQT